MKLSKIYSNDDFRFHPITFNDGFNVIIGEIRREENKNEDTHNLGKSTLADLIDFCLLKKKDRKGSFIFKNESKFIDFVFYLEIKANDGNYITVRRSVATPSKISIKRHEEKWCNFSDLDLTENEWDYLQLSFENAKLIIDAILDLEEIKPWNYRTALSYALRSQDDFSDIFKLKNFIGKHLYWKPYIGCLLGFDFNLLIENYELKDSIDDLSKKIDEFKIKIGVYLGNEQEVLTDILSIKKRDSEKITEQLNSFNFECFDMKSIESLVSEIESELSEINRVRYYLKSNLNKLYKTVKISKTDFNISETERIFKEAGIIFGDGIKKTYSELIEFNRKITEERSFFASEQIKDLEGTLAEISKRTEFLNKERAEKIQIISQHDTFEKYKSLTNELVDINSIIAEIKQKLALSIEMDTLLTEKEVLGKKKQTVIDEIKRNRELVVGSSIEYNSIKEFFKSFVRKVLNKDGLITTEVNKDGNLDFYAGIVDNTGSYTSESDGHSYKKILCIGFDIAVLLSYSSKKFIRFLYHDGGLETLDDRKKTEFLDYVRGIHLLFGTQYILTLIDSDLPTGYVFQEHEIIRVLHDDGMDGLLFNIPPW
ncbi:Uncharacterized protein conserved in bacteria (DUF2326) [Serratia liquefaciens]|uniref:DUF2326 domain-containing protein n=1 Tax=Serratia liquefaciens TaxID=614 RepID=UPI0021833061|nr:DUF2326 domain-containing protein [Serratia liquefaciens]CAI2516027.1 Uncharacterized protein conserved in bacteria (DUF2326) [Serratia liquefaciens]